MQKTQYHYGDITNNINVMDKETTQHNSKHFRLIIDVCC